MQAIKVKILPFVFYIFNEMLSFAKISPIFLPSLILLLYSPFEVNITEDNLPL